MAPLKQLFIRLLTGVIFTFSLVGCALDTLQVTLTPTVTATPTITPIPMAFLVNGEGMSQQDFDAELARYEQFQVNLGINPDPERDAQVVRDDLIDQLLLAQDAVLNGYVYDEAALQTRVDALAAEIGGIDKLSAWEAEHGYTHEEFIVALRRQMAAAWMRDQVLASVPGTAEQVHVKQILFYNVEEAQNVFALLQSGWDFNSLAAQYDPVAKGELGWFPRDYLPSQAIEEAAFGLQPGQFSAVVESNVGYHILYMIERDPERALAPDALISRQERALEDWLTQKRNMSSIVIEP